MTVSYASQVATNNGVGVFLKLLARWKGSVYKLIWADLIIYLLLYYALNFIYIFALNQQGKTTFEIIVRYCNTNITQVPLSFLLGFYVNLVINRWWNQFKTIPYPDNLALLISAGVKGLDEHGRLIRRTLARYACLSFAATLSLISPKVKKRFPTLQHFIDAGLLMSDELKIMQDLQEEFPNYPRFWLPLAWAGNIAVKARQEGLIRTDAALNSILQEINAYRTKCGDLINYDWINIPLVYTQVITIAVYTYFLTSIVGRQLVGANQILQFPILAVLEFFFYMGWVRVAETLINPFGEDDDDFEVLWLIDRHVQVSYLIVDKIHDNYPKLMQDQYWFSLVPQQLPFTVASEKYRDDAPQPSTKNLAITKEDAAVSPSGLRHNSKSGGSFKQAPSIIRRLFSPQTEDSEDPNLKNSLLLTAVTTEQPSYTEPQMETAGIYSTRAQTSSIEEAEEVAGEVIDFDKLKKLRQLLVKEKLRKYMDLMKEKHSVDDEDNIIEDIINVRSKTD